MAIRRPFLHAARLPALLLVAAGLVGCATRDTHQVAEAVITPLRDLNLVKQDIPAPLLSARAQPYALPEDARCERLRALIQTLDEILGPDLDEPEPEEYTNALDRGVGHAKDSLIKTLGNTTGDVIPYRHWVRKLSGAERRAKRTAEAITAGSVRRAFLKGLLVAQGCGGSAEPQK